MKRLALIVVASVAVGSWITHAIENRLRRVLYTRGTKSVPQKLLVFTPWTITAIKKFEDIRLKAYKDTAKYRSIGYGHRVGPNGPERCTVKQAEKWLRQDIKWFHAVVTTSVKVKINQYQRDALVSFAFNIGPGGFTKSSAVKYLNAGDYKRCALEMTKYVKSEGKVSRGLFERRQAEVAHFLKEELHD